MSNYYYMWPCGVWSAHQCDHFWVLGGGIPVKVDSANDTSAFKSCTQSNGVTLLYKICKVNGYAPAPGLCALLIPQSWTGAAYNITELLGSYDDCDGCANAVAPQPTSHGESSSSTTTSSDQTTSSSTSESRVTASSASTTSSTVTTQSSSATTTTQSSSATTTTQSSSATATTQSSSATTTTQSSTVLAQGAPASSSSAVACCTQTHNWTLGDEYVPDNVVRRII